MWSPGQKIAFFISYQVSSRWKIKLLIVGKRYSASQTDAGNDFSHKWLQRSFSCQYMKLHSSCASIKIGQNATIKKKATARLKVVKSLLFSHASMQTHLPLSHSWWYRVLIAYSEKLSQIFRTWVIIKNLGCPCLNDVRLLVSTTPNLSNILSVNTADFEVHNDVDQEQDEVDETKELSIEQKWITSFRETLAKMGKWEMGTFFKHIRCKITINAWIWNTSQLFWQKSTYDIAYIIASVNATFNRTQVCYCWNQHEQGVWTNDDRNIDLYYSIGNLIYIQLYLFGLV